MFVHLFIVLQLKTYHDDCLCLGTECNCVCDPQDPGDGGNGVGATIDSLRNATTALRQADKERERARDRESERDRRMTPFRNRCQDS